MALFSRHKIDDIEDFKELFRIMTKRKYFSLSSLFSPAHTKKKSKNVDSPYQQLIDG